MEIPSLSEQSLRQLVETAEPPCVSIYIPVDEKGTDRDQARIRLKNRLGEAEQGLAARGMKRPDIEAILEPLRALLISDLLREGGAAAYALLRSRSTFESLKLPNPTPEITIVSDCFYVKPLLELVYVNQRYRVLALGQDDLRLFEGDRYTLQPLGVARLPSNIDEALNDDDDSDQTLQFHTQAAPAGGERPAVFHGQVLGKEDVKERILRFCQLVDKAVTNYFGDQDVPLILAAAEPLPGLYRQANSYRNLQPDSIPGNPKYQSEGELHAQAWKLMAPRAKNAQADALDRLHQGLARNRGTTDLAVALSAAREGRVETMFVNAEPDRSGAGGPASRDAAPTSKPDPAAEERVNLAVVETLRHGGRAFTVAPDELPEGAAIGALYRY